MTYTFSTDGAPQIDARNNVYYMAAGNSPAMMAKNVGQGSQYLWTYRDGDGNFLDGAKTYSCTSCPAFPPRISGRSSSTMRSAGRNCRTDSRLPRSAATRRQSSTPTARSILSLAPTSRRRSNWIQTVPGKGWFPIFRFYSPTEAYLRQDVEAGGHRGRVVTREIATRGDRRLSRRSRYSVMGSSAGTLCIRRPVLFRRKTAKPDRRVLSCRWRRNCDGFNLAVCCPTLALRFHPLNCRHTGDRSDE